MFRYMQARRFTKRRCWLDLPKCRQHNKDTEKM